MAKRIGRGSYGCVYRPAVPCSELEPGEIRDYDETQAISKVFFSRRSGEEELKNYDRFRSKADATGVYIPKRFESCEVAKHLFERDEQCDGLLLERPYQIVYEYGGDTLRQVTQRHSFAFVICCLRDVFAAVTLFFKAGVVHADVKPDNLVFRSDTGRTKIIDFGLYKSGADIFETHHQVFTASPYRYWPNEASMDWTDENTRASTIDRYGRNADECLRTIVRRLNVLVQDHRILADRVARIAQTLRKRQDRSTLLSATQGDLVQMSSKFDTYMLGITVLELFAASAQSRMLFANLDAPVEREQATDIYAHLLELIERMVDPDWNARIRPKQALDRFDRHVRSRAKALCEVPAIASEVRKPERKPDPNPSPRLRKPSPAKSSPSKTQKRALYTFLPYMAKPNKPALPRVARKKTRTIVTPQKTPTPPVPAPKKSPPARREKSLSLSPFSPI